FPGNVRELHNVLARLVVFPDLGVDALESMHAQSGGDLSMPNRERLFDLPLSEARDQIIGSFESSYIQSKLRAHGGNVTHAARASGISRQFFYRLLERYGLRPKAES